MSIFVRECNSITEDGITVDVNSLGFTGTLAIKSTEQLTLLKKIGPLSVLHGVSKKN